MKVMLARCLRGIGVNGAVFDRPNIGLAFPSRESLTVPQLHVPGVIIVSHRLRAASQAATTASAASLSTAALASAVLSSTAQRRERSHEDYRENDPSE